MTFEESLILKKAMEIYAKKESERAIAILKEVRGY